MPTLEADELTTAIRGSVARPGDPTYDRARSVYNGMIDRRPAAVVRARDAADVMRALEHARAHDLDVAVRGGGHSVPGYGVCDDGLVIDLSAIRNVRVDPEARTARVGGGALIGDLDHATQPYGLATPAGFFSTTGVGGLTLGGGIGAYLSRKHGLTCDNLLSADVITADGRRVTAREDENPELFWALRGGGGNFGVVTSFEFRLHPVGHVTGGPILFDPENAADLLRFYAEYTRTAPRDLGMFFAFDRAPGLPFVPDAWHGRPVVLVVTCWSGAPEDASDVLDPIRDAGRVVAEHVGRMPYASLQCAFDDLLPPGLRQYWKSDFVRELTDEAVEAHVTHGLRVPNETSTMHLYAVNGAVHDVPRDATAFAFRDATFATNIVSAWTDPADDTANRGWVRDYYDAVHRYSGFEAGYTNFMSGDDEGRARENYGPAYDRLRRVKAAWDPGNLFRLNQNVVPV